MENRTVFGANPCVPCLLQVKVIEIRVKEGLADEKDCAVHSKRCFTVVVLFRSLYLGNVFGIRSYFPLVCKSVT